MISLDVRHLPRRRPELRRLRSDLGYGIRFVHAVSYSVGGRMRHCINVSIFVGAIFLLGVTSADARKIRTIYALSSSMREDPRQGILYARWALKPESVCPTGGLDKPLIKKYVVSIKWYRSCGWDSIIRIRYIYQL